MSRLMEQAIQKARELPELEQEALASIMVQEIEFERRWDDLFARPESAELLSRMADRALSEARAGRARKLVPPSTCSTLNRSTRERRALTDGQARRDGPQGSNRDHRA